MKITPKISGWLLAGLLLVPNLAWSAQQVETDTLRLTFSDDGQLQSAVACFPACQGENVRLMQFSDQGLLRFAGTDTSSFRLLPASGNPRELIFSGDNGQVRWLIPEEGYLLKAEVSGVDGFTLSSGESFRPREAAGFGTWLEQSRYAIFQDGDVRQIGFDDTDVEQEAIDGWAGYRSRFWAAVVRVPGADSVRLATAEEARDGAVSLSLDRSESTEFSLYLGPLEPRILKQADEALSDLLYAGLWFFLRWICFGLFYLLAFIQQVIPAWGLAIMILSVAVGLLMTPLSRIADRLQQQVHETEARLAPEMAHIKKNYKGEQQSAKILALYEKEKVHPLYSLKSLMGVAVVIPVFIGAFDMLAENIHLLNTGFLWISDLSRPDSVLLMPFGLPFFGSELNLLPFLMTGLSVVASALHNPPALDPTLRKRQLRNMVLMAVAFFALFYTFPAGMVLYWTTNNLISVIKSLWARR